MLRKARCCIIPPSTARNMKSGDISERRALFSLKLFDKPSLVWAYRLSPVARLEDEVACEAAPPHPTWLHFNLNDAPARRWLSERAELPPATLIASMWGMNVGGVPFSDDPHGFAWVSTFLLASIVLAVVGLRKLRGR